MIIETPALFRAARRILEPAQIELQPGSTVAVAGLNGAGKSTYISAICGLLPTGAVITPQPRISLMPQVPAFPNHVSVSAVRALYGVAPEKRLAWDFELDEKRAATELSVGERQAVAIELACGVAADLYIFDEPFSALDMRRRRAAIEALKNLRVAAPASVILVASQRAEDFMDLCEQFVVVAHGKVSAVSPGELALSDRSQFEEQLLALMTA